MPSPEPRYGWRRLPGFDGPPYSDAKLEIISDVIRDVRQDREDEALIRFKDDLQELGGWYRVASHQHGMPTVGQACAALNELSRRAKALAALVSDIDDVSVEVLLQQRGLVRDLSRPKPGNVFRAELVRGWAGPISMLAREADAAASWAEEYSSNPDATFDPKLSNFVKPPLRRNRTPFYRFVRRLADLFQDATGQEPNLDHDRGREIYGGPFFEMVSAALLGTDRDRAHKGLGRTIQQVLTDRAQATRENRRA